MCWLTSPWPGSSGPRNNPATCAAGPASDSRRRSRQSSNKGSRPLSRSPFNRSHWLRCRTASTIPESTISPDGRYGVSILVAADQDGSRAWPPRGNELVQLEPLRVLATIEAGYERNSPGHERITSRWTKDSSGLLWIDKRESFPRAMVYLRLEDSKVLWQRDLLDASKTAISDRSWKRFLPRRRRRESRLGTPSQPAFRIDIELPPAETDPSLPLRFAVSFDSHPEDPESARFPLEGEIVGSMAGVLDQDGRLIWSELDVATGQLARERRTAPGPGALNAHPNVRGEAMIRDGGSSFWDSIVPASHAVGVLRGNRFAMMPRFRDPLLWDNPHVLDVPQLEMPSTVAPQAIIVETLASGSRRCPP